MTIQRSQFVAILGCFLVAVMFGPLMADPATAQQPEAASPAQNEGAEEPQAAEPDDAGSATSDDKASDQPPGESSEKADSGDQDQAKPQEAPPTNQSADQTPADSPAKENEKPTTEEPAAEDSETEKPAAEDTAPPEPAEPRKLPNLGSVDTPMLPDQPWRVHDLFRPRPPVVAPPAEDVTIAPPGDAIVLFGGQDLNAWAHRDRENVGTYIEPQWTVRDGFFEVTRGNGDLFTIENFGDVQLHIEWAEPEDVRGRSQGRGNSGIKFLGLYEVQILDSYNNLTYADGQAASIYGQFPPAVNVSRKPGEWQSYDIIFEMPEFDGDKTVTPAYLTVFHNGVLVHLKRPLAGITGMRSPGRYSTHPPAGPIMLQDHGNPVRFRNIWARHLNQQ